MELRVSFALVLTLLTLVLSLVPAVLIWVTFSDVMGTSLLLLQDTAANSTDVLVSTVQDLLLVQALADLDNRVTDAENEIASQVAFLHSVGMANQPLTPPALQFEQNISGPYGLHNFADLTGHPYLNYVMISGVIFPNGLNSTGFRTFWLVWQSMLINAYKGTIGRTLYYSTADLSANLSQTHLVIYYTDQVTGQPLFPVRDSILPYPLPVNWNVGWENDADFNLYSGQTELAYTHWILAPDGAYLSAVVTLNLQTVSADLLAQLAGFPKDRLFIFFRQPHGHLIGASNGKFYSMSNVDARYINPVTNPPNFSLYQLWNCTQSTDVLIREACLLLIEWYGSWPAIPALRQQVVLNGSLYWIAVGLSQSSLNSTVVMLKNRESVMGAIDASNAHVNGEVKTRKAGTYVILSVVTLLSVLLPLAIGIWLGHRLLIMAGGMDYIARLEFDQVASLPNTRFSELHRFQRSYVQMERGLRAFGRFVPQAVIKNLLQEGQTASERMLGRTVTIMFADIEGFSTICEEITPEDLVEVCTEYFEYMCASVISSGGTVDKFIGDCIMAIWNAPHIVETHEARAVGATLEMQNAVMGLHTSWNRRGLPQLRFRAGIHTGVVLVGNFGCSHRVSYTVLGDNVNVAARLEALNKRFGTYVLVSLATQQECSNEFHFRHLAKVTVPGRAEVFSVYEVVCAQRDDASAKAKPKASSPSAPISVPNIEVTSVTESGFGFGRPAVSFEQPPLHVPISGTPKNRKLAQLLSSRRRSLAAPCDAAADPEPEAIPQRLGQVVYHWEYVDRLLLLADVEKYTQAYEALMEGKFTEARLILRTVGAVDRAWDILRQQLELGVQTRHAWDGILQFREK